MKFRYQINRWIEEESDREKELEKYKSWKEDKNGEREIEKEQEKETDRGKRIRER